MEQGRQNDGLPVVVVFLTDGRSNDQDATALAAEYFHQVLPEVRAFLYSRITNRFFIIFYSLFF